MLMKKYFYALITICIFSFSLITSTYNANALDEVFYTISNYKTEINQSETLKDDLIISSEYLPKMNYSYNNNAFSYYDQLDDNNKSAYDSMKIWLNPTTEEFTVTFPDVLSYQSESLDMSSWSEEQYNDFWNYIFSNIQLGKNALMFDYPEIFWLNESRIKITLSSVRTSRNIFTGIYTMKITELKLQGAVKDEYTDIEGALEYQSRLENSLELFEAAESDRYQQVKYIHDYISNRVSYNVEAPYHDSVVGLFCEPYEIVCEGYSKAFKLLCDKYDIPCIVVPGNINPENNTGHMWNYVLMDDGEWYGVDCTWDDTDSELNPTRYNYFLKGSEIFNKNHIPDTEYYTAAFIYPELCAENYEYNVQTPLTTTVTEMITTCVSTEKTESSAHLKGDYNIDGKINSADLVSLRSFLLGINVIDMNFPCDDLNDDNVINIYDYIILTRKVLGGI